LTVLHLQGVQSTACLPQATKVLRLSKPKQKPRPKPTVELEDAAWAATPELIQPGDWQPGDCRPVHLRICTPTDCQMH